jgi:tetratricopeptide (TPR) repeat protein
MRLNRALPGLLGVREVREDLSAKHEEAKLRFARGVALYQKGHLDAGIAEFRKAIRLKLELALAHNRWGASCEERGKPQAAVALAVLTNVHFQAAGDLLSWPRRCVSLVYEYGKSTLGSLPSLPHVRIVENPIHRFRPRPTRASLTRGSTKENGVRPKSSVRRYRRWRLYGKSTH